MGKKASNAALANSWEETTQPICAWSARNGTLVTAVEPRGEDGTPQSSPISIALQASDPAVITGRGWEYAIGRALIHGIRQDKINLGALLDINRFHQLGQDQSGKPGPVVATAQAVYEAALEVIASHESRKELATAQAILQSALRKKQLDTWANTTPQGRFDINR